MAPKDFSILVVDDEENLRKAVSNTLDDEGFKTLEASDGEEALRVAFSKHPDLILLDVIMPGLDGKAVLERLSKDSWGKKALVILLTNLSDPIKMAELAEIGSKNISVFDYLIKSDWELSDIVKKVKEKLGLT